MSKQDLDLFGEPIKPPRRSPKPQGYVGIVGMGKKGETCGSCKHAQRLYSGYKKCALVERTNGAGTDILLRTPACSKWEAKSG